MIQKEMSAPDYLVKWHEAATWNRLAIDKHQLRLRKCADAMMGSRFADIGCAYGHSTDIMWGFKDGQWTGVDFCKIAIDEAHTLFPALSFKALSGVPAIPTLGKFDSVVCSEVIEHVEDDVGLVNKLLAITTYNLIITTPSVKVNSVGHVRTYTQGMVVELMEASNCISCVIEHSPFFFYITVGVARL